MLNESKKGKGIREKAKLKRGKQVGHPALKQKFEISWNFLTAES